MRTYDTFEKAFIANAQIIMQQSEYQIDSRNGSCYECMNLQYTVIDTKTYEFQNKSIGRIDYKYAELFYDWMIDGCTDSSQLLAQYPNVARFLEKPKSDLLPANFNTFYGVRILKQLPKILEELNDSPNSRRAVISILQESDLVLLGTDETLEFPCCSSATYYIRDNKLHSHVVFRSQNMGQVAKLDMYLWGRLQCEIATKLNIEVGKFISTITNAHVFTSDFEYINEIIKKQINEQ